MGQNRVELLTPSLSEKCSNQLSYWPKKRNRIGRSKGVYDSGRPYSLAAACADSRAWRLSHRKEVIQPHLPVRLPCYDFTLLTRRTFDVAPLRRLD